MKSSNSSTKNSSISGKNLAENNILFFSQVHHPDELPKWLRPIHQLLIRRRTKIPCNIRNKLKSQFEDFRVQDKTKYKIMTNTQSFDGSVNNWDLQPDDKDFEAARLESQSFKKDDIGNPEVLDELEICLGISTKFANLRKKRAKERDWQNVLQEHIFTAYQSDNGGSDPFNDMQLRWELHQETHWTEFNQSSPSGFRDGKTTLTYPVPDFTYGFPIIDIDDPVHEPYLTHRLTENFSLPTLHKLRGAGVLSSPRKTLAQWNSSKSASEPMSGPDLMCFPWAVVEVKSAAEAAKIERMCYCQAANASAAALSLREKLHLASKKSDPKLEALVIFSFTCVGAHVKLWLTYTSSEKKVVMQCIWATSLEVSWGVFVLRMVLKNMQEWVNQDVRPELSRWIEGARGCPTPKVFLSPRGGLVEQGRKAASQEPQSERLPDSPLLRKRRSSPKGFAQYFQETSQMVRSAAPSPTLSTCSSEVRRRAEVNSFGYEVEDEYEEIEESEDYKDGDYNDEDEDSESSVDEGYCSPPKKKTGKKVTPISSRQSSQFGVACMMANCSKPDGKGIVDKTPSPSFSGKKATSISPRQCSHFGVTCKMAKCSKSGDKGIVDQVSSLSFSGKKKVMHSTLAAA